MAAVVPEEFNRAALDVLMKQLWTLLEEATSMAVRAEVPYQFHAVAALCDSAAHLARAVDGLNARSIAEA